MKRRRFTAWMAAWVIVLGTLVPLISQAGYRLSGDSGWLEVCTVNGFERIAIKTAPAEGGSMSDGQECPWCTLHSSSGGLPPSEAVFRTPSSDDMIRIAPSPVSPRPSVAWSPAQPRAPPLPL